MRLKELTAQLETVRERRATAEASVSRYKLREKELLAELKAERKALEEALKEATNADA